MTVGCKISPVALSTADDAKDHCCIEVPNLDREPAFAEVEAPAEAEETEVAVVAVEDTDEEGEEGEDYRDTHSELSENDEAYEPGMPPVVVGVGMCDGRGVSGIPQDSDNQTPGVAQMDAPPSVEPPDATKAKCQAQQRFEAEETFLIFDWDDTVLPSSWVQGQGLRLDAESQVSEWQREQLAEVAQAAGETLRIAKQLGTVVIVTNAERGWIELSCQKFMPTLYPSLESLKLLSARTTYESPELASPLDWKLCAFDAEIRQVFGAEVIVKPERRKNVLSFGDSVHEREALLRTTAKLPNCRSKSLKFVERPDIGQICKQHSLVTSCFDHIVHHDGNLDLCIRCA